MWGELEAVGGKRGSTRERRVKRAGKVARNTVEWKKIKENKKVRKEACEYRGVLGEAE